MRLSLPKTKVVVLGGSFGGLAFAKALHGNRAFDVVIIEKRGYCDLNFASARLLQDPDLAKTVIREFKDFKWLSGGNVKVDQATVTQVDTNTVTASNGESYMFDYCVIATGSQYTNEFNKSVNEDSIAKRLKAIKVSAEIVNKTGDVLVIGGGPTGIEMAAEAKEAGAKRVTLVHRGQYLLGNEVFHKPIHRRLVKIGVDVVLGQSAELVLELGHGGPGQVRIGKNTRSCDVVSKCVGLKPLVATEVRKEFDSGLELGHGGPGQVRIGKNTRSYDMVFECVGLKPVCMAFMAPLGDAVLKANGGLRVNSSFQLQGYTNIFAIGDAVDLNEVDGAHLATLHASQVAQTIKSLARNPNAKLQKWKEPGFYKTEIVCMGKKNSLCLVGKRTVMVHVPRSILTKKWDSIGAKIAFPEDVSSQKNVGSLHCCRLFCPLWPW